MEAAEMMKAEAAVKVVETKAAVKVVEWKSLATEEVRQW
jgi:hypothetical protein